LAWNVTSSSQKLYKALSSQRPKNFIFEGQHKRAMTVNEFLTVTIYSSTAGRSKMKEIFNNRRNFYLNSQYCKFGGVCSGVATFFDIPHLWIRLAEVIGLFFHAPSVLIA